MFFIHWLSRTSRRSHSIQQPNRDRTKERRLKLLRLEQRRVLNADFTFVAHGLNLDHVDGDLTVREVSGSTGQRIEFDLAGSLWQDSGSTGLFAIDNSSPDHSILSIAKSDLESLSSGVSLHAASSDFDLRFDVQSSSLDLSGMHGTLAAEGFGEIHQTAANDHQVRLGDVSLSADQITLSQFHGDDITLNANEIDLTGGVDSFSGATLSIHSAATPNIELGGTSDTVHELNFTGSDITALDAGFHRISFESTSADADSSIHVESAGADFHHAITPGHDGSLHLTADSVQIDGALSISGGLIDVTATHAATISATGSLISHGGQVHVDAGESGTLLDSGRIDVSNDEPGGIGGTVHLLGEQVGLFGSAEVDASGHSGGGEVLIGGDLHGDNDAIHHAAQTFVGHDVEIHADALQQGDGGQVVVWSDEVTQVYGALTARGGALMGDGGLIETSSHNQLIVTRGGDASAAHGNAGTWLLDPLNVKIVDTSTIFLVTEFNQPPFFTPTISGSEVTDDAIEEQLNAGTTVVISTFNPDGLEAGDVTQEVSIDVTFTNAGDSATFIISAANDIFINGGFSVVGMSGSLNVLLEANTGSDDPVANQSLGNVNINANIDTNGGSFSSTGVKFDSTSATIRASGGVSITQTGTVDLGEITTEIAPGMGFGGTTFISGANVNGVITVGEGNVFIDGGNADLIVSASDERQSVMLSNATGGTFTISWVPPSGPGETTAPIPFDATPAMVKAALEGLDALTEDDINVSGGQGGPFILTFKGAYQGDDVDEVTTSGADLIGSGAAVTQSTIVAGGAQAANITATDTIFLLADRDVIVEAMVTAGSSNPSADLSITSDANSDGVGGFWLRESGNAADARLNAGGNITIVGAKLIDDAGNPGGGEISLRIDADDKAIPQTDPQIVAGQDLTVVANFGMVSDAGDIVIDGIMQATDGALTVFFTDTAFLSASQSAGTDLLFQNAVRLTNLDPAMAGTVTLTAGNDATLANTLDDSGVGISGTALSVVAGGDVLFVGKIGSMTDGALNALSVTGDGLIDFLSSVTVDGNINVVATSETGRVTFQDAVTTNIGSVTITNAGLLVTSSSAQFNVATDFVQNGAGSTELGAGIKTENGLVSFAQGVLLTDAVTIDTSSGNSNPHNITFSGTIDSEVTGANEEQTISLANLTGPTFTISWDPPNPPGQVDGAMMQVIETTGDIAFDATAADVKAALVALPSLTDKDIAVTGDPGGPFTLTFLGAFRGTNVNEVTLAGSGLPVPAPDESASDPVLTTIQGQAIFAEHNPLTLIAGTGAILFQGNIGDNFIDVGLGVDGDQTLGNLTVVSANMVTFSGVTTVAAAGAIDLGFDTRVDPSTPNVITNGILINGGSAPITFQSGQNIRVNGNLRSEVDLSLLAAGNVTLTNTGSIVTTTNNNNVTIVADTDGNAAGAFQMDSQTAINVGTGYIDIRAAEVFLGRLTSGSTNPTNADNPAIRVIATVGAINDINGDDINLEASQPNPSDPEDVGAGVVLEAVTGIGTTGNSLETDIASLSAFNHDRSEQQMVTLENATGGNFTISWNPPGAAGLATTFPIAFDATADVVKGEFLRTFSSLTSADLDVSGNAGGPFTLTFLGALGKTNVDPITTATATGLLEEQTITLKDATSGTFTISWDPPGPADVKTTAPIPFDATADQVEAAFIAAVNDPIGTFSALDLDVSDNTPGQFVLTFRGPFSNTNVPDVSVDGTGLTGTVSVASVQRGAGLIGLAPTVTPTTVSGPQTVTVANATGGTFTISWDPPGTAGVETTTPPIPFDATAADVKAALVAFTSLTDADINVSLDPGEDINSDGVLDPTEDTNNNGRLDPGPYTLTFVGAYSQTNVAQVTTSGVALIPTGATGATVTSATISDPRRAENNIVIDDIGTGADHRVDLIFVHNEANQSTRQFANATFSFESADASPATVPELITVRTTEITFSAATPGQSSNDIVINFTKSQHFEDANKNDILDPGEDLNGNNILDRATIGVPVITIDPAFPHTINIDLDIGEDNNGNGILDTGEDANNNGNLDGTTANALRDAINSNHAANQLVRARITSTDPSSEARAPGTDDITGNAGGASVALNMKPAGLEDGVININVAAGSLRVVADNSRLVLSEMQRGIDTFDPPDLAVAAVQSENTIKLTADTIEVFDDILAISAKTQVTTALDNVATTLIVVDPSVLPAVDANPSTTDFFIRIDSETLAVRHINFANNELTVIRGVNSTMATSHVAGTLIADISAFHPSTQLAAIAPINAMATSLTVVNPAVFVDPDNNPATPFLIQIESEVFAVTNIVGNQLTVLRGQNGTAAAAHDAGTLVTQVGTDTGIRQYIEINARTNFVLGADRVISTDDHYINSLNLGEDLNGNGQLDKTEDGNGDGILQPAEDYNNNGLIDVDETTDTNGNGVIDRIEDFNGDGILQFNTGEDLNRNGVLDLNLSEDKNGNLALNTGEDLNGNGVLDLNLTEDSNGNGILDLRGGKPATTLNDDFFSQINHDVIHITADSTFSGSNGEVLLGLNSTISTDNGIEQLISPRPNFTGINNGVFTYDPGTGFFSGDVVVSNFTSRFLFNGEEVLPDGTILPRNSVVFLGTMTFTIGAPGEKNLILDIDWGDHDRTLISEIPPTTANTIPARFDATLNAYVFDPTKDQHATRYLIPEGGAKYSIPHEYSQAAFNLTSADGQPINHPGRGIGVTSDPIQVRFAVSQHSSIVIDGQAVLNPRAPADPAAVPQNAVNDISPTGRGVNFPYAENNPTLRQADQLFQLSSTNVLDQPDVFLPRFDNGIAAFAIPTPPSVPIPPADVPIPPPALPSPFSPDALIPSAPQITTETSRSSAASASVTTDEYFELRRTNEDGSITAERLDERAGESLLNREQFEEYVRELGDGEYEIFFITRDNKDGTTIPRSVIQFRLESGRLAPPANDSPNLFKPFKLVPVPKVPKKVEPVPPNQPNNDGAAADKDPDAPNDGKQKPSDDEMSALPLHERHSDIFRDAEYREGQAPAEPSLPAVLGSAGASPSHLSDTSFAVSGTAQAAGDSTLSGTALAAGNSTSLSGTAQAAGESTIESDSSETSPLAVGLLLLAGTRWRKNRFNPSGSSLFSKTARLVRKRFASADDQ